MAANIHTTSANAGTLVWGSLRLAPIVRGMPSSLLLLYVHVDKWARLILVSLTTSQQVYTFHLVSM